MKLDSSFLAQFDEKKLLIDEAQLVPELYANPQIPTKQYLDDYIRTYVEKDIILTAGIQKQNEFMRFMKLLAGRTRHILNFSELSKDVSVSREVISGNLVPY